MKHFEIADSEVVDLGRASAETKGDAMFEIDVDEGQLRYVPGLVED